jgi:hypothetical protein
MILTPFDTVIRLAHISVAYSNVPHKSDAIKNVPGAGKPFIPAPVAQHRRTPSSLCSARVGSPALPDPFIPA